MSPEVILYTRQNCRLCERAKEVIRSSAIDFNLHEVDIDLDPALQARFTNDVPVISINGQEVFRHRLDRKAFDEALRQAAS